MLTSNRLGLLYSFNYQLSDFDHQDDNLNVRTKLLFSFSSNTWNLKNPLLPDPRIKLAGALYAASDNMFDRLVNLKSLFVSGLIFRFYNCPSQKPMDGYRSYEFVRYRFTWRGKARVVCARVCRA